GGTPGVRMPASGDLPLFVFFGQNYSTRTILTLNPVTWTLCLEVLFYALLPLLGAVGYRWSRGRARRQAALLAGLIGFGVAWNAVPPRRGSMRGHSRSSASCPTASTSGTCR